MGQSTLVVNHAHRFAPAASGEEYVYGACAPGWHSAADNATAVEHWIAFVRERGIERVCCLLAGPSGAGDCATVDRYRREFGREHVLHAPVADGRLIDEPTLTRDVVPFLADSLERDAPVVVHCLTGIGRTGQVLAAWLVAHRDYEPREAVSAVRETGRDPHEAIQHGHATFRDLRALLESVR